MKPLPFEYVAISRREYHGTEKRRSSRTEIRERETNKQSINAVCEEKLGVNATRDANGNHRVVSEAQIVEKREGGVSQRRAQRRVGKKRAVDQLTQNGNERVEGELRVRRNPVLRDCVENLQSGEQMWEREMEETVGKAKKHILVEKTLNDKKETKNTSHCSGN